MSDLGDLLELLHLATTRTRSIHAAIAAVAHWRAGVDLSAVDWPYADSTELLVDSEHGILLRMEFLLDRTPFIRWTVEEVAFNEVMPDSLFERI